MRISLLLACLFLAATSTSAVAESLSHGRFRDVQIYRPTGNVKQVALFLSGETGWDPTMAAMATQLTADGWLIAGIDLRNFIASLEEDDANCVFPDGDLENLSHFIQAYYKLPTYFTPFLVGYSSGASLAFATLAQAPNGIFAGALSISFSDKHKLRKALCKPASRRPATLNARFIVGREAGHDDRPAPDWLSEFRSAHASLIAKAPPSLPPPPADLADLPLIEVPATGAGDLFAVLLSGDGGWAGLDKEVAAALSERGIPVVGVDSLRYFWKPRTPDGLAKDMDRITRFYASRWNKTGVLLIGYSQGADVLPFAFNRLPAATRGLVRLTALIGVSDTADFEFHVTNWLGGSDGLPVKPETDKLSSSHTLCLYGEDDDDSLCPTIGTRHARVIELSGGHHFDGDYQALAKLILTQANALAEN